MQCTRLSIMVV